MKPKRCRNVLGMALAVMCTGCAVQNHFTALASKNVNLDNMKIDKAASKGVVTGEDCQHIVIFFPTSGPPTLEEAADKAVEPVGAQLIVDASTNFYWFYLPLIYGATCWSVSGEAYDTFGTSH
jgi:hypothetical protein